MCIRDSTHTHTHTHLVTYLASSSKSLKQLRGMSQTVTPHSNYHLVRSGEREKQFTGKLKTKMSNNENLFDTLN